MVKPLHGRGNKNNAGAPLKVLAYQIPDSPEKSPWETTLVCDFLHNSHNFHPVNWDSDEEEEILITGMEGTWLIDQRKKSGLQSLLRNLSVGRSGTARMPKGIISLHDRTAMARLWPVT